MSIAAHLTVTRPVGRTSKIFWTRPVEVEWRPCNGKPIEPLSLTRSACE
jgi:hypothetical protein